MSLVFQNIDPPPPHRPASMYPLPLLRGGGHTRWVEKGVGGSIFWKTPGTALYSTYVPVSTLWVRHYKHWGENVFQFSISNVSGKYHNVFGRTDIFFRAMPQFFGTSK